MELLSLAILIVIVGALFWLGWFLARFIFIGLIIYALVRYWREIPNAIRLLWKEFWKK